MNAFERLNDGIFLELLYTTDPELRESKEILERIGKRQLYKYVGSFVLPNNTTNIHSIEDELTTFLSDSDYKIDRNSMVVEVSCFHKSFFSFFLIYIFVLKRLLDSIMAQKI